MRVLRIAVIGVLLVANATAIVEQTLQYYKSPVRRIQGRVLDPAGAPIRLADVTVFSNPEVWSDDSLNLRQKRERQKEIAATWGDDDGKFKVKKLPKGSYEVEFSRSGFNVLSVIVQIDPSAQSEKFCVTLAVSGVEGSRHFILARRGRKDPKSRGVFI